MTTSVFDVAVRVQTAMHEAGHAVVGVVLGIPVSSVTIVPQTAEECEDPCYAEGTLGHVTHDKPAYYADGLTVAGLMAEGIMSLAGPMAQKLLFDLPFAHAIKATTDVLRGDREEGASGDYEAAQLMACALYQLQHHGEPFTYFPEDEAEAMARFRRRARALVIKHERQIKAVAAHLIHQKDFLSGAELLAIVQEAGSRGGQLRTVRKCAGDRADLRLIGTSARGRKIG
jgi:hypothetical protein